MEYGFTHKKCRGSLKVDLTNAFEIFSPGLSMTRGGFTASVIEIREKDSSKRQVKLTCSKCSNTFLPAEDYKEIEGKCTVCDHSNPVSDLFFVDYLGITCETCKSVLLGKSEPETERVARYKNHYNLKGMENMFIPLLTIFAKPVV